MDNKYKIVKFDINQNVESALKASTTQGLRIMDTLQNAGIVEAKFSNGDYFKSDKDKRVIVGKKIMLTETKTDLIVRIPKDGCSEEEIINTEVPKPTQKMLGAYIGKSQSTVSTKKTKRK